MDRLDIAMSQTLIDKKVNFRNLSEIMKPTEKTLRNKVDPNCETNVLTVRESLQIMQISGNVSILEALAGELGYRLVPVEGDVQSLMDAVLKASKESGDVSAAISDALEDRTITPRELGNIKTEIQEAVEALHALGRSVKAHADASVTRIPSAS